MSKENTTNTFIACGTWLKTPFYTSSAGVELPLGTQRIPHPLSLLFKSGAYLCGQMCLHKLVSTLSKSLYFIRIPPCGFDLMMAEGRFPGEEQAAVLGDAGAEIIAAGDVDDVLLWGDVGGDFVLVFARAQHPAVLGETGQKAVAAVDILDACPA